MIVILLSASTQNSSFGVYEILAILGALAWLPPIISFIANRLTQTKLIIISNKELELGYTTLGPILNIQLAFIAEEKKALIKNIKLRLTHEKNDTQDFSWDWFEEILSEINIPNTGLIPTRKNQRAIAINVYKDNLVEKKIGFQQDSFKEEYKKLVQSTVEDSIHIINAGLQKTEIKSKRSYNDLIDLYKNSFAWKVGKYKGTFIIQTSDNKIFEHTISFVLNSLDIKVLDANIQRCNNLVEKEFIDKELKIEGDWLWTNPIDLTPQK